MKMKENKKIYDIDNVLDDLYNDGLRLQNYGESVRNKYSCVVTAMRSNYKAYEYVGELYKFHPDIIDLYYSGYIKNQEYSQTDQKYSTYIPQVVELNKLYEDLFSENKSRK